MEDEGEQGILSLITSFIRKIFHLDKSNTLTEEIHGLMDEGQAKGLITNEESEMVYGVLDLKDISAHSIMIPRTEISSAPADATLGEAIKLVTECGHTRIPIYKNNIDEIIGILHSKDILKLFGNDPADAVSRDILRQPYFVPTSQNVGQLLKDMKENKTHLAIVTDEYGGTAGILTIEDILEEIVGDIMDEHDDEQPLLTPINKETLLVDARLDIGKLEEYLKIKLPDGDFESVGGFVIHLLGRIPDNGEILSYESIEITIKNADQRKINEVIIKQKMHSDPVEHENPPGTV